MDSAKPSAKPSESKPTSDGEQSNSSRILPEEYEPSEHTVVIGRGKKIKARKGNLRLFEIVKSKLSAYSVAGCKTKKSTILVEIVNLVKDSNTDHVGFVKQDSTTGRWYEVSMLAARTTVAQAFRDTNHIHYRSSKQSKQRRRRQKKMVRPTVDASPLTTLRSVFRERLANDTCTRIRPQPRHALPSMASFQPAFHLQYGHNSSQGSMARLHYILDEAVKFADTPASENQEGGMSSTSFPATTTTTTSASWDQEDPFEPVPIGEAFEEVSDNDDGGGDDDDDEPHQQDIFQVFDMFSAADMRAALRA